MIVNKIFGKSMDMGRNTVSREDKPISRIFISSGEEKEVLPKRKHFSVTDRPPGFWLVSPNGGTILRAVLVSALVGSVGIQK